MRWRTLLLTVLVVASLLGPAAGGTGTDEQVEPPSGDRLAGPEGMDGYVWPYTSRRQSVTGRTLALNVIVKGDHERVRQALVDRSTMNWSTVDDRATVDTSPWRPAHGSVRYTYVTSNRNVTGRWVRPAYQLAVGSYFGQRTHIRAYPGPTGDWTALQAHTEYWDWFRVRHTVTGVATGAHVVEQDLQDEPFVASISRGQHGYDSTGSDGSWTIIEFLPALVAAGMLPLAARQRLDDGALLAIALGAVVLGVRAWGLAAAVAFPRLDPKLIVATGYPILAIGPPLLVVRFARDHPPRLVALLAATGLGVGTALDLAVVGVARIPLHVASHRVALATALGALALGTARGDRHLAAVGLAAWVAALVAPLVGIM